LVKARAVWQSRRLASIPLCDTLTDQYERLTAAPMKMDISEIRYARSGDVNIAYQR